VSYKVGVYVIKYPFGLELNDSKVDCLDTSDCLEITLNSIKVKYKCY